MQCEFCNKSYSSLSSLKNHKSTAKFCLQIQNKSMNDKYKCSYCTKIFTTKKSLLYHIKVCKQNETLLDENKDIIIVKYETIIEQFKEREKFYVEQINELQDKLERLASISKHTTNTTNNTNTKINIIGSLDLSEERISNIITSKLCGDHIVDGMVGIAKFVKDEIISSENGDLLYNCVDGSRQIFKFKNEKGDIVKDQKATKLIGVIQPALKRKTNNMYFEYDNYLDKDEEENNDKYVFLKDTAQKIYVDISDMHQNTKFCSELTRQVKS